MINTAQRIEIFRDFANKQLKNHPDELKTNYQNRQPASNGLELQDHSRHKQIFQKEFSDKIEELLTEDNRFLRPMLTDLKDRFAAKLRPDTVY